MRRRSPLAGLLATTVLACAFAASPAQAVRVPSGELVVVYSGNAAASNPRSFDCPGATAPVCTAFGPMSIKVEWIAWSVLSTNSSDEATAGRFAATGSVAFEPGLGNPDPSRITPPGTPCRQPISRRTTGWTNGATVSRAPTGTYGVTTAFATDNRYISTPPLAKDDCTIPDPETAGHQVFFIAPTPAMTAAEQAKLSTALHPGLGMPAKSHYKQVNTRFHWSTAGRDPNIVGLPATIDISERVELFRGCRTFDAKRLECTARRR